MLSAKVGVPETLVISVIVTVASTQSLVLRVLTAPDPVPPLSPVMAMLETEGNTLLTVMATACAADVFRPSLAVMVML